MSEADEKFLDHSKVGKAGLNEEGAEVEGHKFSDKVGKAGKAGLDEDDGPEVEGHKFADKVYKQG